MYEEEMRMGLLCVNQKREREGRSKKERAKLRYHSRSVCGRSKKQRRGRGGLAMG